VQATAGLSIGCSGGRGRIRSGGRLAARQGRLGVAGTVEGGLPLAGLKAVYLFGADSEHWDSQMPGELLQFCLDIGTALWILAAEGHAAIDQQLPRLVARSAAGACIEGDRVVLACRSGRVRLADFDEVALEGLLLDGFDADRRRLVAAR
jgi:hypothetical protein